MKITYFADDGYVTGDRPLTCSIDEDFLLEHETVEDALTAAEDEIRERFLMTVSPSYDSGELENKVRELFAKKA